MSNGLTTAQAVQLILDGQQGLQKQISLLVEKVDGVVNKGCAHREDDIRRIKELEDWRTRGIVGIIILAASVLANFFGVKIR